MATRAELVYRVAKFLRKVIAGEPLGDVEYTSINEEIPRVVANLNKRNVIYIDDYEEIDDDIFDPLARIVAAKTCTDFGMTLAALPGFENEPLRSEMELRAIGRATDTKRDVIRAENF